MVNSRMPGPTAAGSPVTIFYATGRLIAYSTENLGFINVGAPIIAYPGLQTRSTETYLSKPRI